MASLYTHVQDYLSSFKLYSKLSYEEFSSNPYS